ncbi:uncharacterized protein LOC119662783 [Teleopsis dalmanni]|uniref:uncharacterized protein LOC119662783 n=1 Tax=Teleopsis dalmanni TaxID=139649 RepID=UPI0018CC9C5B|nr:uncharacterized protein LOC119662783 [Teleopsis dalmanni]
MPRRVKVLKAKNRPVFEPVISLENPITDYKRLMNTIMATDVEEEILKENYMKIAEVAQKCIWDLLFAESDTKTENEAKATELLKAHKYDSAFYCPWDYNEWIVIVRDELLSREMFQFWRNVIVKCELGPCWSRDSDCFTGDNAPEEFYKFAGCVAPFSREAAAKLDDSNCAETVLETGSIETQTSAGAKNDSSTDTYIDSNTMSVEDNESLAPPDEVENDDFGLIISLETPLKDFTSLILNEIQLNDTASEEELEQKYKTIAEKAREIIWELIFIITPLTEENQCKAIELLKEVKSNACSYGPAEYNNWIISLRDELLRLNMIEIWSEQIVKLELGPCWARDCDWFDDAEDYEVLDFYNHAGCEAPFKNDMLNAIKNNSNLSF